MAGKSSIMRSLCSVALLSACGLYAPVEKAIVPYTDAFMLRTFSADAPIEGRSSFAVEMNEMKCVIPILQLCQLHGSALTYSNNWNLISVLPHAQTLVRAI
jgi:DNA mismatch repair ATPase MutS